MSLPLANSTPLDVPGHEGVQITVINQSVENDAFPKGTRALSVFLVNHRQPVKEHKDTTYLFQTQLQLHLPRRIYPPL
jgi:hypothetical protein